MSEPVTQSARIAEAARTFSAATFDPKILTHRPDRPDPWARYETWRYTGPFSRKNRFKNLFPGFWTAAGAFAVYCTYEHFFLKPKGHGDEHGAAEHGEGHI